MPESPGLPNLLDDLIEGRLAYASPASEASQLVRLARQCSTLRIPGPDRAAESRMRGRFSAVLENDRRQQLGFGVFHGLPGVPALRHRIAGLALTIAVAGSAAGYTTGIGPIDAIEGIAGLARSLVLNLTPGGGEPVAEVGTSTATPTTAPAGTRTATPIAGEARQSIPPGTVQPTTTPQSTTEPGENTATDPTSTPPAQSPAAATSTPAPTAPTTPTPDGAGDDDGSAEPGQPPPPEDGAPPVGPLPDPDGTASPPPGATPAPEPTSEPDGDGESSDDDSDNEDDESRESRKPGGDEGHG